MRRALLATGAALLLWGCPQEEKQVLVTFGDPAVPTFSVAEGTDCLTRFSVSRVEEGATPVPVWSAEAPMPVANTPPCALGFPIIYGQAPGAKSTWPRQAPPLERGRRYIFSGDGTSAYSAEFRLP